MHAHADPFLLLIILAVVALLVGDRKASRQ